MFMKMSTMVLKLSNRFFPMLLLPLLFVSCGKKKVSTEPAKIAFEVTDLDIGDVYYEDGEKVIEFKISNEGGRPFHLRDVVSTCECTRTEFSDEQLYGGESTTIKAYLNPEELPEGAFERMLGVYTDLKKRPDTLYFHGVAKHR
jgi:hypothetical protein